MINSRNTSYISVGLTNTILSEKVEQTFCLLVTKTVVPRSDKDRAFNSISKKKQASQEKVTVTVFWDAEVILLVDISEEQKKKKLTSAYYKSVFKK